MKVVFAPNAFKESLDAPEAAAAMAKGWKRIFPEAKLVQLPVADGGDGTARAFARATKGRLLTRRVSGPLGQPVAARFAWAPATATVFIEMAEASGLRLVPPKLRNPMKTTTAGTGELAAAALRLGAKRVVVGLGGSATTDGGTGFTAALGWRLLDRNGRPISPGGEGLERLARIAPPAKPLWGKGTEIVGATDVRNRLCGPDGAAAVFGPQKGATPDQVKRLDAALANLAEIIKRDLCRSVARIPGAGAAGGFGAGLAGFFGARLASGIEIFLDLVGFDKTIEGADLVLTGEGRIDRQTAFGKAPIGVARAAARQGIPAIALAGSLGPGWQELLKKGFAAIFSIAPGPISLEEAMRDARVLIERQTEAVAKVWGLGKRS